MGCFLIRGSIKLTKNKQINSLKKKNQQINNNIGNTFNLESPLSIYVYNIL